MGYLHDERCALESLNAVLFLNAVLLEGWGVARISLKGLLCQWSFRLHLARLPGCVIQLGDLHVL